MEINDTRVAKIKKCRKASKHYSRAYGTKKRSCKHATRMVQVHCCTLDTEFRRRSTAKILSSELRARNDEVCCRVWIKLRYKFYPRTLFASTKSIGTIVALGKPWGIHGLDTNPVQGVVT